MTNIDTLKFQTCPRRINELGPWERTENLDMWDKENKCTFCGSLHPDEFLKRAKEGDKVTPTDKNYKCYLNDRKVYFQHFNDEQQSTLIEMMNNNEINFAIPGRFYVPPFFCQVVKSGD